MLPFVMTIIACVSFVVGCFIAAGIIAGSIRAGLAQSSDRLAIAQRDAAKHIANAQITAGETMAAAWLSDEDDADFLEAAAHPLGQLTQGGGREAAVPGARRTRSAGILRDDE